MDNYFNDPQAMGWLGIGAGLLEASGPQRFPTSLGQGLSRGLLQGSQLAQSTAQQQLAQTYLGEQMKQLQAANARQAQLSPILAQFSNRLNQPQGAPQAPQGNPMIPGHPGSSTMAGGPVGAPVQQQAPSGGLPFSLEDIALLKLIGGPDLTSAYTASQPNVDVTPSGVQYDKRSGRQMGTLPVVSEAFGGYQMQPGPSGYTMGAVPGAANMRREALQTGEQVRAQYDLVRVPDGRGGFMTIPRAQAVQSLGGGGALGAPQAPGGLGYENPAQSAFSGGLAGKQAEELAKGRQAAGEAAEMITTFHEGRKLLDSGVITGVGAEFLTNMGRVLNQSGVNYAQDPVANTQAFSSVMAQNVGKIIKQFGAGTGLSDADREYAAKMAGGQVTLDEAALRKIIDIGERASRNVIKKHNKDAQGIQSVIPLSVQEPPEYQKPGQSKGWSIVK